LSVGFSHALEIKPISWFRDSYFRVRISSATHWIPNSGSSAGLKNDMGSRLYGQRAWIQIDAKLFPVCWPD